MIVTPVIERELRSVARQPFTYTLRSLVLGAAVVVSVSFVLEPGSAIVPGGKLLALLHSTMFCAIWILVPSLTSDCISRERREGTLGLLFLTALTGPGVVAAKAVAHGLRALTLFLAVLPAFTLPFLLGGVSWQQAVMSAAINFGAICLAVSAGVLSSAWSKRRARALVGAILLEVAFFALMITLAGYIALAWTRTIPNSVWPADPEFVLAFAVNALVFTDGRWGGRGGITGGSNGLLIPAIGGMVVCLLCLVLAIFIAGAKTRRSWRDEPPSRHRLWLHETFCTPVIWVAFLRSWMRRRLEANPIGWLEQRTWSGRLVTWGWIAVVVSLYTTALADQQFSSAYWVIQRVMGWLLVGSLAFSASGSFRRERETGVLELLLVSPLDEAAIIWGRLRGLWGQFLPAVALYLGVAAYTYHLLPYAEKEGLYSLAFVLACFWCVPVIGLYFSLQSATPIGAFLRTVFAGILIPCVLQLAITVGWSLLLETSPNNSSPLPGSGVWVIFFQLWVAGFCWNRLHSRLRRRQFQFQHV